MIHNGNVVIIRKTTFRLLEKILRNIDLSRWCLFTLKTVFVEERFYPTEENYDIDDKSSSKPISLTALFRVELLHGASYCETLSKI